jgi:hypothetical protein
MTYIFDKSQRESLYPFLISSKNDADMHKSQETLNDMFDEYLKLKTPLTEGFTEDIILREISKAPEISIVVNPKSKVAFVTDSTYEVKTLSGDTKIHAPNEVIYVQHLYVNDPYKLDFEIKDLDLLTLINVYKNIHNISLIKSFYKCLHNGKLTLVEELKKLPSNIRTEFFLKLSELETDKLNNIKNEINNIYKTDYELYEIIFLLDQYLISNLIESDDYKQISKYMVNLKNEKKLKDILRLDTLNKHNDYINYNKYIRILKTLDDWLKIKQKIKNNKINDLANLRKILNKSEISIIENSYNTVSKTNECRHYDIVSKVYKNNYIIHEIDEFVNKDINDPNKQLICKLCNFPVMCTHAYKLMTNNYKDINEIYNEYKMEEPIGTKFYCKYCGEFLYVADYLEYKGFVKYTSINIDEEEVYIKNTTWGILKNLFGDLHFSPKINVELLFNKMNTIIFNEVKKFDSFYKINDPEMRRNNIVLYIYIMGGMYAILLISLQKEDNISFKHKYEHTKDVNKLTSIFYNNYITVKWKSSLPKVGNIKDFILNISKRVSKFNTDETFYNIKNNKLIYDEIIKNYNYEILKNYYKILNNINEINPIDEMFKILNTSSLNEKNPIKNIKIPNMDKFLIPSNKIKDVTDIKKYADWYAKYLYKYYKNTSEYNDDLKYYDDYFEYNPIYNLIKTKEGTKLRYDTYENKPIYYIKGVNGFYDWKPYIENGIIIYKALLPDGKYINFNELDNNPFKITEYTLKDKPKHTSKLIVNKNLIIPTNQQPYENRINIENLKRMLRENINFNLIKYIGKYEGNLYKDIVNDNIINKQAKGIDDPRILKLHSYIIILYIYLNQFKNNDPKFLFINKSVPKTSSGINVSTSSKPKTKLKTNLSEYTKQYDKIIKEWNSEHILDWLLEYLITKLYQIYDADYPKIKEFYSWFINYLLNTEKMFTKADIEKRHNKEFKGDDDFDFDDNNEMENPYEDLDYDENEDFEADDN